MAALSENIRVQAKQVLPGGTFGNVSGELIITRGQGSKVWDETGKKYIDYLIGSGPMMLGHSHPEVTAAVQAQLEHGTTFFATNPQGIELAQVIIDAIACADKVRFASSGSEADAFAMRLARAYTGREKILKFEGGYHGYSDYGLMSLAPKHPGNSMVPIPDSPGIPTAVRDTVLVAPFNDADAVESLIKANAGEIAAIFMEPMQRLIPPEPGFLAAVRQLATDNDLLLVFDEVVTGFRLAYGGAQAYYGVTPDLCTLGKVIGGGFPLAAIAGKDEVMATFDAERATDGRFMPQVGTLSGNPVASAAGLATLNILKRPGTYERLFEVGNQLMTGLSEKLTAAGFNASVVGEAPIFDAIFAKGPIRNHRDILRSNDILTKRLNTLLKERGILKAHNKYYVSIALDNIDVEQTLATWDEAIEMLAWGHER